MTAELDGRRQSQRYSVIDTVFLTFRPYFDKMGKLKDISKSGVAFEYVALENRAHSECDDLNKIEIDIFSGSIGFHLARVSCKIVYDIGITASYGTGLFDNRRCGLQFSNLCKSQAIQLKYFIDSCALRPPAFRY